VTPASLITETLKALTLMTLKHWWPQRHWSTETLKALTLMSPEHRWLSITEAPKYWKHWHRSTEALTTSVHRLLLTYQTYLCQYRSVPWCRQCFSGSVSVLPVFRCFSDAESSVFRWHQCQCFQCFSASVALGSSVCTERQCRWQKCQCSQYLHWHRTSLMENLWVPPQDRPWGPPPYSIMWHLTFNPAQTDRQTLKII
jgi:hypothetical protein